ncbi:MAG TPA: PDZ domain-containing protein [Blastocatellia bacterium]|nr:PDZ domain-containing protein [Blastocatellia bacterium]
MKKVLLPLLAILFLSAAALAQTNKPLLMRNPTMNKTQIAFSYAGDLWTVPREGGAASRLTSGTANEFKPIFSPDGRWITFSGEYDGNVDVYVIPANGGIPKRLTYHPEDDVAIGWTPDSKQVLFVSDRDSSSTRYARLFTIPIDGTFPTAVALPMGYEGAFSPDGSHLAYVPLPHGFNAWKHYRGGMTTPIWISNLGDSSIEKLPRDNSNDFNPMWVGNKIYFLSDRNGSITLFAYDIGSKKVEQLIRNDGLDIKSASASEDAIVYEQFGSLNLFDLKSGKARKVNVAINGDMLSVRPHFEKVGALLTNPFIPASAAISPSGARAVFQVRGEILTVPAEKGDPRNLTNTTGVMERSPAWSPDGRLIAYLSDESGEYALHLRAQSGMGEVKKLKLGDRAFFSGLTWSPDSKKIAYVDNHLGLWYIDIEKGTPVKVDIANRATAFNPSWSPDSRWIAYIKPVQSWYRAAFIYSLDDQKSTQITDGLSDVAHTTFDKSGKYLYFSASIDIGPAVFGFDMTSYPHRPTRSVYLAVLRKDLPSPLAAESDEEKVQEDKKAGEKPADQSAEKKAEGQPPPGGKKPPEPVRIDFDRIGQRIIALPIPARTVVGLRAGKPGTLYVIESPPPTATAPGAPAGATLHKFELEKRKLEKVLENIGAFEVSANSEKVLYRLGPSWFIGSAATLGQPVPPGGPGAPNMLKTADIEVYVDPPAEWQQMYREAFRIERDFFYDPNYHGLDLEATAKKYAPYLDSLAHRADLNYLLQEIFGELTVGHLYVSGGDFPNPNRVPNGLLGCDYAIEKARYRFAKIYDGENWNPGLRAPLTQPGVNVQEGEYLLSVNGRNLTASDSVYAFFENTGNKQVVIRVGPNPDGSQSREVTVVPVPSEVGLRNLAWVEGNRRKVDKLSNGKLAYVWLPDTAGGGYTFFNRYYFSQLDKEGAVIDERFNSGGQAADYVIDYLKKPLNSYWALRDGEDYRQPFGTMPGPKAMIVNEYAGSGGDYLPYMFRRSQIGPLIGKRTWGGLVGIGGTPQLMDGGSITAPNFAFYTPEGKWEIENHGVAPDIEVEMDPAAWRAGRDPQLEKAVEVLLEELKKHPLPPHPKRPPFPNYHNGKVQDASK